MSDLGQQWTEEEYDGLVSDIDSVYSQAEKELKKKLRAYMQSFAELDEKYSAMVEAGELSKQQYQSWRTGAMMRGERYAKLIDELAERATNANETAREFINTRIPVIFSNAMNYMSFRIEQVYGNIGLTLTNDTLIRDMLVNQPELLPFYPKEKALARGIDLDYGRETIRRSLMSGILQQRSTYDIADMIAETLTKMNRTAAIRAARTAVTSAENSAYLNQMYSAKDKGIEMKKQWTCVHDERTRTSHQWMDGDTVPVDKPFKNGMMKPADPDFPPAEVYNCRCRMVSVLPEMSDYKYQTYKEWKAEKEAEQ